jgi:tRNA(fMet)-specific endonuclease VapC
MRESGRRRAVEEGSDRVPGFLLDTNVVIAVLGQEDAVLARLEEASDLFFVLVIVLGELRFGARKSGGIEENMQRIEDFAAESNVLPCDEETSRRYGVVKDGLRRIGRPIPENDIWIAATGLRHGLVLVTRDSHVEGLRVEQW